MKPLKETIAREGQPYVDEPIYAHPKAHLVSRIATSVAKAFGGAPPRTVKVGTERVRLRWVRPDGKGGLTPR